MYKIKSKYMHKLTTVLLLCTFANAFGMDSNDRPKLLLPQEEQDRLCNEKKAQLERRRSRKRAKEQAYRQKSSLRAIPEQKPINPLDIPPFNRHSYHNPKAPFAITRAKPKPRKGKKQQRLPDQATEFIVVDNSVHHNRIEDESSWQRPNYQASDYNFLPIDDESQLREQVERPLISPQTLVRVGIAWAGLATLYVKATRS